MPFAILISFGAADSKPGLLLQEVHSTPDSSLPTPNSPFPIPRFSAPYFPLPIPHSPLPIPHSPLPLLPAQTAYATVRRVTSRFVNSIRNQSNILGREALCKGNSLLRRRSTTRSSSDRARRAEWPRRNSPSAVLRC